jgi:hypothetical protein
MLAVSVFGREEIPHLQTKRSDDRVNGAAGETFQEHSVIAAPRDGKARELIIVRRAACGSLVASAADAFESLKNMFEGCHPVHCLSPQRGHGRRALRTISWSRERGFRDADGVEFHRPPIDQVFDVTRPEDPNDGQGSVANPVEGRCWFAH